jgi:uncharacterized membrane protein
MLFGFLAGALLAMTPVFAQGNFIDEFFIKPLVRGTGYNIVNTLTFALILVIAAVGVYKLLKWMKISIDRNFLAGVIPFVAMGGILRAWEDLSEITGVKRDFLLVSPLIYVTIFLVTLALLVVSVAIARKTKKISYYKLWFALGALIDIFLLSQLKFTNVFPFIMVLLITLIWLAAFALVKLAARRRFRKLDAFLSPENMFIILIHLFDAATTFVALQYLGYFEQHVLPGFLIATLGAWTMFLLKIAVVPIVLYAFDRELKNEQEQRTFLKLVVLILGLGPGLRNWLRMIGGF